MFVTAKNLSVAAGLHPKVRISEVFEDTWRKSDRASYDGAFRSAKVAAASVVDAAATSALPGARDVIARIRTSAAAAETPAQVAAVRRDAHAQLAKSVDTVVAKAASVGACESEVRAAAVAVTAARVRVRDLASAGRVDALPAAIEATERVASEELAAKERLVAAQAARAALPAVRAALPAVAKQATSATYTSYGSARENSIVQQFRKETGVDVRCDTRMWYGSLAGGARYGGRVDGLIGDDTVLEAKGRVSQWIFENGIPEYDRIQAEAYMRLLDRPRCTFVQSFEGRLRVDQLERDDGWWSERVEPRLQRFLRTLRSVMTDADEAAAYARRDAGGREGWLVDVVAGGGREAPAAAEFLSDEDE